MPARFYCPARPRDGFLQLSAEESRHLIRVCRLGVGDCIEIFDGQGSVATAHVYKNSPGGVQLQVENDWMQEPPPPLSLTLASAIPKGDRFDWLIEKATELGIERLIPLTTARSVVDPRGSKLDRLRRLIIEASKQCSRASLMILDDPIDWTQLVESFPNATRFVADPKGASPARWPTIKPGGSVVLAVGPEGGLTPAELDFAFKANWFGIRFSQNTLRIETAGLAGSAALLTRATGEDA